MRPFKAHVRPFKAHVIEDEESDRKTFVEELNRTGIFAPDTSSDVSGDYMDKARGADIISLDARIDGVISPSLRAASRLISNNPDQSGVFVTLVPKEVINSPGNFCILLLKIVLGDLDRLKQIKGVYLTARLDQKIKELISGILSDEEGKRLLNLYQERRPLVRFSEFVGSWLGRLGSRSTASEQSETVEAVEAQEGLIP